MPYREPGPGLTVEEQKRLDEWNAKPELEKARIVYEGLAIAATPSDPAKREKAMARFREARDRYFGLLAKTQRTNLVHASPMTAADFWALFGL